MTLERVGWRHHRHGLQGFAIGALAIAAVVAVAGAMAPAPVGFLEHTSNVNGPGKSELATYLAEVEEHGRLISETLALEATTSAAALVAIDRATSGTSATPEDYVGEHARLIGATLGGEFKPAPGVGAQSAPAPYVEEHERLLRATLGNEWGSGSVTAQPSPIESAAPAPETYIEEHARLLAGIGIVVPSAE